MKKMEAPPAAEKGPTGGSAGADEDAAAVAEYVARFAGLPSRVRILPAEGSLRPLLALAGYPVVDDLEEQQTTTKREEVATTHGQAEDAGGCKRCALEGVVVGLDFDQTLVVGAGLGAGVSGGGVQVRGGDDTVATLQTLWAAGARLAVVTATPASPDNARLIAGLLRRLALAREFASAALDTAPLLTLLRSLAPARASRDGDDRQDVQHAALSADATDQTPPATPATADQQRQLEAPEDKQEQEQEKSTSVAEDEETDKSAEERRSLLERETKRIVALLALSTGRRPGDLVRIGHSTIAFDAARSKVLSLTLIIISITIDSRSPSCSECRRRIDWLRSQAPTSAAGRPCRVSPLTRFVDLRARWRRSASAPADRVARTCTCRSGDCVLSIAWRPTCNSPRRVARARAPLLFPIGSSFPCTLPPPAPRFDTVSGVWH
jgi:hypothetical protein